ncbi:MAG: hypothetical protein HY961_13480 [Ignavibacteriae bacterium]|nr:hypothetical protein [Ignavibacteriota bacterium]
MKHSVIILLFFAAIGILGCGKRTVSDFYDNRLQYADKVIEVIGNAIEVHGDTSIRYFDITDGKAMILVLPLQEPEEFPKVYNGDKVRVVGRLRLHYQFNYWPTIEIGVVVDRKEGGSIEILQRKEAEVSQ